MFLFDWLSVIATSNEPLAGWINNFYGPTGVVAGAGLGLLRSIHADGNCIADVVPCDKVVNAVIAAAWDIANKWYVRIQPNQSPSGVFLPETVLLRQNCATTCAHSVGGGIPQFENRRISVQTFFDQPFILQGKTEKDHRCTAQRRGEKS